MTLPTSWLSKLRRRSTPAKVGGFREVFGPLRTGHSRCSASDPRRPPGGWAHRRGTDSGRGAARRPTPPPPSRAGGIERIIYLPARSTSALPTLDAHGTRTWGGSRASTPPGGAADRPLTNQRRVCEAACGGPKVPQRNT